MYRYHCYNQSCERWCGDGHVIESKSELAQCPYCDMNTLVELNGHVPWPCYPLAGAAAGALIAWSVTGTFWKTVFGAVAGAVIGLLFMPWGEGGRW